MEWNHSKFQSPCGCANEANQSCTLVGHQNTMTHYDRWLSIGIP